MSRRTGVSIGVGAFALFCFLCIRYHAPKIQDDIRAGAAEALKAHNISASALTVDGRDVTLSGAEGSPEVAADTKQLVEGIDGVRKVDVKVLNPGAAAAVAAPEAPPPDAKTLAAKTETQTKLNDLLSTSIVEFDPGSARLTPHGKAVLDAVAPLLKSGPPLRCEVQGYTDNQGRREQNIELSLRRAETAKDYLVEKGVPTDRLIPQGFGDANPVASNATPDGRHKNRRIDFVLKEKP